MADSKKTGLMGFLGKAGNKKLIIFSVSAIFMAVVFSFAGLHKAEKQEVSRIRSPADAGGNIAGDKMTPEYLRIRDRKTAEEVAQAERSGGSATAPIRPVESASSAMPTSLADGLNERAPESPSRPAGTAAQTSASPSPHPPLNPSLNVAASAQQTATYHLPALNEQQAQEKAQREAQLVQAMQQQIGRLAPTNPVKAEIISFQNNSGQAGAAGGRGSTGAAGGGASGMAGIAASLAKNGAQSGAQDGGTKTASASTSAPAGQPAGRFQMPAPGTIFYSRILGEVNSDTPGPVLAEVLQGPFVNARLIGSFKSTPSGLVLSFNTMTVPYTDEDGNPQTEVMSIKTVAVDTSHLGTAIASDINNHLLLNLGMAFGTSFLQGLGMAAQESGSYAAMGPYGTTVANPVLSVPGEAMMALGSGAATAGQIFQNIYGNKPPTIIVNADTPFGLLFLGSGN